MAVKDNKNDSEIQPQPHLSEVILAKDLENNGTLYKAGEKIKVDPTILTLLIRQGIVASKTSQS